MKKERGWVDWEGREMERDWGWGIKTKTGSGDGGKMMEIQKRDLELAGLIYDHQFVPVKDVARYPYSGMKDRRVRDRLQAMEKAGFIRREPIAILGGRSVLRLTKVGQALAQDYRSYTIPQRKGLDVATLIHDASVIRARVRLREFWDATWVPERALKKELFPQIPDGVLVFEGGSQVAIEIENSIKGMKRFHELQERWRKVPIKLVLYIATKPSILNTLKRYLEKGPKDLPFGLIDLALLEAGRPQVWSTMGEIDLLARRKL